MAVRQGSKAEANGVVEEVVEKQTEPTIKKSPKTSNSYLQEDVGLDFITSLESRYNVHSRVTPDGSIDALLKTKVNGQSVMDFLENKEINLKMAVLDKNIDSNLLYSFPILYREEEAKGDVAAHVKYAPILLTSTGRNPLTAQEYTTKANNANNNPDLKADVYTYASALNDVINTKAVSKLTTCISSKAASVTLLTFNGKVVNTSIGPKDDMTDAINLIKLAITDIASDFGIDDGFNDGVGINIAKLKQDGNVRFRYDIEPIKGAQVVDKFGFPVRADFALKLYLDAGANVVNWKLNDGALSERLVTLYGYFTGVPSFVPERRDANGGVIPANYVISPRLVITNIECLYPDLSSVLLGIACSHLLFSNKQYVKVIHDTMTPETNPGLFNLITKWEVDAKGRVAPINLLDKMGKGGDVETLNRLAIIDRIFRGTPVISVDSKLFGENFNHLQVIKEAQNNKDAMDDIVKALGILTNGQITEVPNPVFGWEKLPSGYYFDNKNNQKDIRDWEIERYLTVDPMLEDKTAIELMFQCMNLNGGIQTYGNKIDVLASYLRDGAYIDGEIDRITIRPEFLGTILNGLAANGFVINVDARFTYNPVSTGYNFNYVEGYNYSNIGTANIGNVVGNPVQGYGRYIFHNPFIVQPG